MPQTGTVFQTRTVVVSLLVGVGITLVATVGPALRATRVPPIAAVREGSILPRSRFAPVAPFVALGLIAAGAVAFGTALGVEALQTRSVLLLIAVGCISVFLGVGLISSRLVRPLVKVVGQPARHGGGEAGGLASENAVRNPSRTASTAAALMIGLALVTVVATLGTSMRNSDKASIASQLDADFVVTSENGFDVFQAQAGDLIASVPGVGIVTNVRQEKARIAGATATVHGVDPTIGQTARFQWTEGNDALLADLGADGVILKQRFADKHNLAVGSTVSLLTPRASATRSPSVVCSNRRRSTGWIRSSATSSCPGVHSTPRSQGPRTSSRSWSSGRTQHRPRSRASETCWTSTQARSCGTKRNT